MVCPSGGHQSVAIGHKFVFCNLSQRVTCTHCGKRPPLHSGNATVGIFGTSVQGISTIRPKGPRSPLCLAESSRGLRSACQMQALTNFWMTIFCWPQKELVSIIVAIIAKIRTEACHKVKYPIACCLLFSGNDFPALQLLSPMRIDCSL